MRSMKWCAALLGLTIISSSTFADESDEQAEAASLISGYLANLEAIGSFDVLIDIQNQWVGSNGAIEEHTVRERLIVDTEANRCCDVQKMARSKYIAGENGAEEKSDQILRAVISDGSRAAGRAFPRNKFPISDTTIENVLGANDSTLIRAVGVVPFPYTYRDGKSFQTLTDYFRYGKMDMQLTSGLKGSPAIRINTPYTEEWSSERVLVFDEDGFAPERMRVAYKLRDLRSVSVKEEYEVINHEGVYVVRSITGERKKKKVIDDVKVRGVETYDVTFHWLSINKPVDDKSFSFAIVEDANTALKMVSSDVESKKAVFSQQ